MGKLLLVSQTRACLCFDTALLTWSATTYNPINMLKKTNKQIKRTHKNQQNKNVLLVVKQTQYKHSTQYNKHNCI